MPRSFALGSHFEELIDGLVKGSRYNNASEVVREGLRQLKVKEIRRSIKEGRRDGRTFSAEEVFDRLEAKYTAMAEAAKQQEKRDQPAA